MVSPEYGLEFWVAYPWHETSSFSAIAEAWQKTATKGQGGTFFIIKFVTDVFTNNTSSIVVTVIKLVSVTRFQIFTVVVTIYIRYIIYIRWKYL